MTIFLLGDLPIKISTLGYTHVTIYIGVRVIVCLDDDKTTW